MGRRSSVNAAAIARRSIIQNARHRQDLADRPKTDADQQRIDAAQAKRALKASRLESK